MRILHTADWHLGRMLEGRSRMEEQTKFCNQLVKIVKEENIDIVIVAGDIYNSPNPPSAAETLFYDTLEKISCDAQVATVIISGNHDSPEKLGAVMHLAKKHGVIVIPLPSTVVETGQYGKHIVTDSAEGYFQLEYHKEDKKRNLIFTTIPYPSERRLNDIIFNIEDENLSKEEQYSNKIKEYAEKGNSKFRDDTINITVAHLFCMDTIKDGSERDIELGGSYLVSPEFISDKVDYVALGHIHKHQKVPKANGKAYYSGAPIHYNKRETNHENSVIIVDIDEEKNIDIKRKYLDTYKKIHLLKCKSIEEAREFCIAHQDENSWVYIEIYTDEMLLDSDIKELRTIKDDIVEILLRRESEYKIEDDEIIEEKNLVELFKEFYRHQVEEEIDEETLELFKNIAMEEE